MNSGDPFLNCVDGSSSSTDDEDETEELINFMIAGCRPRISSRFTKVLSTLSESAAKKHRKITVDAIDITLSGNEDETFAYISFRHLDSCIPQRSNKHFPRNFFFKGNGVQGKDVLKNLSNCNVMNSACITNAGSCISLSKYPADMLQTFLTSSSDRSAVIQAPMTILYGYFSHKSLTKFLPLIESSNIILKCSSGFQRYRYYELIEKNRHQTSLHFDRHVIQKFSKKKHFSKLRQIVLSNPSIACLSFSCSFTKFNFEEFFKLITDPTFKLPNQTINLCFTFWCKNFSLLYEEINEKKDILEVILADRAQYSDSIRVRFHVAWDGSTVLALCPGEIERF
uniref:Uncharacterized protein n=1 Tax=Panagrolaimus sp. ES5 TaxID=591445 RepID=A0AC34F906_9BILA